MAGLLLDTNVVVWLLLGDEDAVPEPVQRALQDELNPVAVSAVSVWEIALKRSLSKLEIADGWPGALIRLPFEQMPVTAEHAGRVEELPWHHRDPFDRLLVAQAMVERRSLVTADRRLDEYDVDVLW